MLLMPQVAVRRTIDEGGDISQSLRGGEGDGEGEREERKEEVTASHGRRRQEIG